MSAADRFDRLDELTRELEAESGVHLVDFETDEDEIVVTANVRGVPVQAWYVENEYEDKDLFLDSSDEGFEDPDDVRVHLNSEGNSEMDLEALLDEIEWLRSRHGPAALSDYRDHLRGDT